MGKGAVGSNTAVGNAALSANTTGFANTAGGNSVLTSNTTGSDNTAYGYGSLFYNTTGNQNIAVGYQPLYHNTTGGNNTATGFQALYSNIGASGNTAHGYKSLFYDSTGSNNTAVGFQSLYLGITASYNTASGFNALYSDSSGNYNTATGYSALYSNSKGNNNTAMGYGASYKNTIGHSNVALGTGALYTNQLGSNIIAIGDSALYNDAGSNINNYGSANTAIGSKALYKNTTGFANTAIGYNSLFSNTIGELNTANGEASLYNNLSGSYNIATGLAALYNNTSGNANIAIGNHALYYNTTGSTNTATGDSSLEQNSTGSNNTAYGFYSLTFSNGSDLTAIGVYSDEGGSGDYTNSSALGYNSTITATNQIRLGSSTVTSIGGYAGWSNVSDGRVKTNIKQNVPGLTFINKLQPITYNLNLDAADKIIQPPVHKDKDGKLIATSALDMSARTAKQQVIYTGFIAQDVETAAKSLNYDFSGVDAPKNSKDLYGLRYAEFAVPLVKAVQELSAQNDSLKQTNVSLQSQINELKTMMQQVLAVKSDVTIPVQNISLTSASLQQNTPNPYNQSTAIHYSVPATFTSAQILITDNTGKTLKQIPVTTTGAGTVNINAGSLSAGIYSYSLIVDGAVIDTKKMILAK